MELPIRPEAAFELRVAIGVGHRGYPLAIRVSIDKKILSVRPPAGVDAIYSLRITQSRRATAYRDGDFIRLLTVAPDHDSTYGRK